MKNNSQAGAIQSLTEIEAKRFLRLALEGVEVTSVQEFEIWVRERVRQFYPHQMLIAGSVRNDFTEVAIDRLLTVDFPIAYVGRVKKNKGSFTCPTLNSWFRNGYRPQLFEPTSGKGGAIPWTPEFNEFELRNVAAHGVISSDRRTATYFSFSQIPGPLTERHKGLLELLAPHLHQAYVRVTSKPNSQTDKAELSEFEIALLNWISKGKSDSDIAAIHGRSPFAVKHSVRRLLSKLNASTRHEAVAKALWANQIGNLG